jgi:hypothetical protein
MKREFSWSYQRYKTFQHCKRAYYLSYYKAWNGWKNTEPEETQKLYILKNIKSIKTIFHDILINTLKNLIIKNQLNIKKLNSLFLKEISILLKEIKFNNNKQINKHLLIEEIIFKQQNSNTIYNNANDFIHSFSELIPYSSLWEKLKKMNILNMNLLDNPIYFFNNCIKIWTQIDFLFRDKSVIKGININLTENYLSEHWNFQSGLNKLFISQKFPLNSYSKIDIETHFINNKSALGVNTCKNLKEIQDLIDKSIFQMLEITELELNINIKNFPKNENIKDCKQCIYKYVCKAEKFPEESSIFKTLLPKK